MKGKQTEMGGGGGGEREKRSGEGGVVVRGGGGGGAEVKPDQKSSFTNSPKTGCTF